MVNLVILSEWAERYNSKGNVSSEAQFVVEDILPQAFAFIRQKLSEKVLKFANAKNRAIRDAINGEFLKEVFCQVAQKEEVCGKCLYYYDIPFEFMTLPFDYGIYDITMNCGTKLHKLLIEDFASLSPAELSIMGFSYALVGKKLYFNFMPPQKLTIRYVMDCFNLLDARLFEDTDVLPCPPENEEELYLFVGKWVDAISNGGKDLMIDGSDTKQKT